MKQEEITLKNTKAEILEALNAALEREKNANKIKANPEKEEKEKKIQKAIETSKENVQANIFSDELIHKFKDLEVAIQAEEEKLKDLYGIEKELNQLTIVVNAAKDCIAKLEVEKKEKEEHLQEAIHSLEKEFQQKTEDLQKEYDLKAKALKIEREREQEEYSYKTNREREISNNEWQDEKQKRESALKAKEAETNQLWEEAKANEKHLKDLENQVANIPTMIEKEYQRGKKETTDILEKEHQYATELLKKDFQNTIDRQNDKITSLQEELEKVRTLNSSLQEKMDKAYLEIKELATKTVETSGGVKIIGNSSNNEMK